MANQKILITAALPYANGPLHIGHLAGCYLPADIYARYQRAQGNIVKFVCGSDEHGVPITIRAMREDTTPQAVVDKYHQILKESFEEMSISFDIYSRTSNANHHKNAQDFFLNLYNKGIFNEKESEQYYDPEKNIFLADRYITGTCPVCQNDNAYGDQCEKCGSTLSPEQLINPKSALSNAMPIKKMTKHWFFPLEKYEAFLNEWIVEGKKDIWKNNVYGQCKSWLDSGLHDRAMTRDSSWGIPVPLEGAEGKVLYVWFDAPIGYISATQELLPNEWETFWKEKDTKLVQFIGKDNIVFHCIIFPAMLQAHGDYILPDNVPANEFLNIEGQKVSTSRNWAVWIDEYVKDFPDLKDTLRYVLCANAPETKDNDFTWKDFQTRHNSELVDIFGNFVNRAMVLSHKLCDGRIPFIHQELLTETDHQLMKDIAHTKEIIENSLENYKFRDALFHVIDLARKGNKYLQDVAPWILVKDESNKFHNQKLVDNCLHLTLQLCANLAIFSHPFLPETSAKIRHMLKVVERMLEWENGGKINLLKQNYILRAPELLFRKIEDHEMETQREKLLKNTVQNTAAAAAANASELPIEETTVTEEVPLSENIVFEDFAKIDLRVGTIIAATKVPKADKLLQLTVDMGFEERTILSGIAMHFEPADIIDKKVVVVANLAPRKMRGIESAGMILMTENANGDLVFVQADSQAKNGAVVR